MFPFPSMSATRIVILIAVLHFGCRSSENAATSVSCSKPSSFESSAEILSPLVKKILGTAGTLNADYNAAKEFLASVDSALLVGFPICPFTTFLSTHDSAYDGSRNAWLSRSSSSSHPYPPIGLSKYLLFCRLLSNATGYLTRECQYQSLRDANNAMQSLVRPGALKWNSGEFDQFNVVRQLCLLMELDRDCPSYALEASLALDGVRIQTKSTPAVDRVHLVQLILDMLVDIRNWWHQCPEKQPSYKEYVSRIISKAREIILPRKLCTDDFVENFLIQLDQIDTEYRTSMPCSPPPNIIQAH